jgi:hypothetical protein
LNEWDGTATTIKDSSIMSPCIGAGSKDSENNTFSGVLMGKIKKTGEQQAKHGLYGFNKGEEVFGFKEDGTAFIGKSSGGRIKFDGNKSEIKSASYDGEYRTKTDENGNKITDEDGNEIKEHIPGTSTGMLLDLDNPVLDIKYKDTSLIYFNPGSEQSPELYLQSKGYKNKELGTKIDL